MPEPAKRTVLTMEEVAAMIGRSRETLKYWRQQTSAGTPAGPAGYRLGRRVCYDRATVEAWLDEQRQAARAS